MAQFRRMVEGILEPVLELESAQIELPEELPARRVEPDAEANRAINAELSRAMPPSGSKYSPKAGNGAQAARTLSQKARQLARHILIVVMSPNGMTHGYPK